jgi:hypothetical protein
VQGCEAGFSRGGDGNGQEAVRVVPTDLGLLDDLGRFLGRLGCEVEKGADSLEVCIPFVPEDKTKRVLHVFLANWRGGEASIRESRLSFPRSGLECGGVAGGAQRSQ